MMAHLFAVAPWEFVTLTYYAACAWAGWNTPEWMGWS